MSSFSTASHRLLYYKKAKQENVTKRHIKKKKNGHINTGLDLKAVFHEAKKGFDAQKNRFNVTGPINQIMNQSPIHQNEVILAKSACHNK